MSPFRGGALATTLSAGVFALMVRWGRSDSVDVVGFRSALFFYAILGLGY